MPASQLALFTIKYQHCRIELHPLAIGHQGEEISGRGGLVALHLLQHEIDNGHCLPHDFIGLMAFIVDDQMRIDGGVATIVIQCAVDGNVLLFFLQCVQSAHVILHRVDLPYLMTT